MSPSRPDSCSNEDLSPYVHMLLGFGTVPEWHNLLSTLFIWMITTGFITVPLSLIKYSDQGRGTSFKNILLDFVLNEPLFAIGVAIFFIGLIGMLVLTRYRYSNQMYALKDNHFWLYHRYYHRVAEGGMYGLISLLVSIFVLGDNQMDTPTIVVIAVTCFFTALFGLLAGWSYIKTRQARKAHEKPQPQVEKPQIEEPQSEKPQIEEPQSEKLQAEA